MTWITLGSKASSFIETTRREPKVSSQLAKRWNCIIMEFLGKIALPIPFLRIKLKSTSKAGCFLSELVSSIKQTYVCNIQVYLAPQVGVLNPVPRIKLGLGTWSRIRETIQSDMCWNCLNLFWTSLHLQLLGQPFFLERGRQCFLGRGSVILTKT